MMFLILLIISTILSSCMVSEPRPYRCGQVNDDSLKSYNIAEGDYFCVSNDIMERTKSYSKDAFAEFTDYAVLNKKFIDTSNQGRLIGAPYFADKEGNKIEKVCCRDFWKGRDSYRNLQNAYYEYITLY